MQLTALQVADYWIGAGGPKSRAVEFTAIALGESSYESDAVSSAGAIGPWQIMPFNAPDHGVTVEDLYNPAINARVAVEMSGGGVNCAAWDSCYADIYSSGRYQFLGWPEPGSVDYNNLQIVAVELGHDKLGGAVPPVGATPSEAFTRTLQGFQNLTNNVYPRLERIAVAQRMVTNGAFTNSWRP